MQDPGPETTFSLEIRYDGSAFLGWQIQPSGRTVQGLLQQACERILDQPLSLTGAGRTDTGVHALASLCSFRASTSRTPRELWRGLNRVLPEDIRVRRVDLREAGFNARFSARAREYEYRFVLGADPFRRRLAWCTGWRLDREAMRAALLPLRGRLDCRGLCVSRSLPPTAWCDFQDVRLLEEGDELRFIVRCDRFLHSMVRALAGTLHDIGRGRWGPGRMTEILSSGRRELCGQIAPPQGLYLRRVFYDGFATGGEEGWSPDGDGWNHEQGRKEAQA
jgi:tRNA pseudouridine38-40 synthase